MSMPPTPQIIDQEQTTAVDSTLSIAYNVLHAVCNFMVGLKLKALCLGK